MRKCIWWLPIGFLALLGADPPLAAGIEVTTAMDENGNEVQVFLFPESARESDGSGRKGGRCGRRAWDEAWRSCDEACALLGGERCLAVLLDEDCAYPGGRCTGGLTFPAEPEGVPGSVQP